MAETNAPQTPDAAAAAAAAAARKRRRLVLVTSVSLLLVFLCCGACGLFMLGLSRHGRDVRRFTPAPVPSPVGETDRFYAAIAAARASAPVDGRCEPVVDALRGQLEGLPDADVVAFHAFLAARLAELDTQGLRDACTAMGAGGCIPARFQALRVYLVAMGRPTVEQAVADADSVARLVPEDASCESLAVLAVGVLDARHSPLADQLTAFPETTTELTPREALAASVPLFCARFTCGAADVFEDDFDFD